MAIKLYHTGNGVFSTSNFIKDILKRENIELIHFPTERMVADYYTKPLQGALFRKFRDILMGLAPFPDEERVRYDENS